MYLSGKTLDIDEYLDRLKEEIMPLYAALQLSGDNNWCFEFKPDDYDQDVEFFDTWEDVDTRVRDFLYNGSKRAAESRFSLQLAVGICNDSIDWR